MNEKGITNEFARCHCNTSLFFHRLSRNSRDDDALYATARGGEPIASNHAARAGQCRAHPTAAPYKWRRAIGHTHVSHPVLEDSLAAGHAGHATQTPATYAELLQSEIELSVIERML